MFSRSFIVLALAFSSTMAVPIASTRTSDVIIRDDHVDARGLQARTPGGFGSILGAVLRKVLGETAEAGVEDLADGQFTTKTL